MRVPEKTIELNLCSQLNVLFGARLVWFGLTQEQEAKAGFDACARTGSTMLIFQFKASNQFARGARRFHAPHAQMQALRNRVRGDRRIYYALPDVGTSSDIQKNPDLLAQTWLLDVSKLPTTIPPPTTRTGSARKKGVHYLDMKPPLLIIRSQPFEAAIFLARNIPTNIPSGRSRHEPHAEEDEADADTGEWQDLRRLFHRRAVGAIVR